MALTDAQWAEEVADIVARLIAGTITESQAASELATATADWPTRTLSNADLAARVSRFLARLNGLILTDGTPDASLGELNTFAYDTANGILYGPKTSSGWGTGVSLVGPQGLSAKAIVIAAGLLPADATDAQFATWLANSQIAAVQPYVDDAEAARDAAQAARTGAETAETNAETAATAAAADADATEADRAATESARDATLAAKGQAETAQAATAADRDATGADRTATAADRVATGEDRTAAHASAQSAAEDAAATAADRVATGEDRAAAAASAQAASDDAAATAADRVATGLDVTAADGHRQAAQTAQAAAEQARDEAQAIAGGDFQPQDATLTALAALDSAPGVLVQTGADAFAKRPIGAAAADDLLDRQTGDARYATPAALSAAINALVDGAPTALDTLKEIADALAADDDAIAALVLALDGKQAASATLTALAALTTTAFGRALLEKTDAAALKSALAIAIADVSGLADALAARVQSVNGQAPDASGAITLAAGGLEVGDILTTARDPGPKYLLANGASYLRSAWPEVSPLLPDALTPFTAWTARTLPSVRNWRGMAYGNGVFVTLAANSTVAATSPDGSTWTARTLPSTANWWALTYGNGLFMAVAYNSTVAATSPDGVTWTARTLPSSANWSAITYGNGLFVAVASGSDLAATSPDGVNWTARTLPSSAQWQALTYGNGVFVAAAQSGTVAATSPDGVTWTARTLPSSANWYFAAYGAGLFVIVTDGSDLAATSPDGVNWTARTLPSSANWRGVTFGNSRFVAAALGTASAASSNALASPDHFTVPVIEQIAPLAAYIRAES